MKQQRYLDESGERDWIDDYAAKYSEERFNGAMAFTIGKYYRRLGKKDPEEMELYKIKDYTARWADKLNEAYGYSQEKALEIVGYELEQVNELAIEE